MMDRKFSRETSIAKASYERGAQDAFKIAAQIAEEAGGDDANGFDIADNIRAKAKEFSA